MYKHMITVWVLVCECIIFWSPERVKARMTPNPSIREAKLNKMIKWKKRIYDKLEYII